MKDSQQPEIRIQQNHERIRNAHIKATLINCAGLAFRITGRLFAENPNEFIRVIGNIGEAIGSISPFLSYIPSVIGFLYYRLEIKRTKSSSKESLRKQILEKGNTHLAISLLNIAASWIHLVAFDTSWFVP